MAEARRRLLDAIASGDGAAVAALVGVDPALASVRDDAGVSVLMLARYRHDEVVVAALRAAAPPLDVFEATTFGQDERLVRILAADPGAATAISADGFTALHFAAFFGGPAVARVLLDAGADPDAVSRNAMAVRPLHSAVAGGQPEVALALIAAGADPAARQRHGWTPLHGAADNGLPDVVEALLAAGADPGATNDDGTTARSLAAARGHDAIADRLRTAGG